MIVLVTGASSGFGAEIARRFARAGHRIVAAGRRVDRLEALRAELGDEQLFVLPLDVRDGAAVARAIAGLPPDLAAIDLLVNNAGLALGLEPAQEASLDDWNQMVDTNCKGLMTVTRAVLPGMVARNRGHVVNLGSTAASWPYAGANVYGATKAFVHQFSLNLRADLAGTACASPSSSPAWSAAPSSRTFASTATTRAPPRCTRAPTRSPPATSPRPCSGSRRYPNA